MEGKVKLCLRLTYQALCHEGVRGSGYINHIFLTTLLAGGYLSASRPGRFIPGERATGTHWIGRCVDTRDGLNMWRIENSYSHRDSKSDPLIVQSVASRYTDYAVPAPLSTEDHMREQ
jgi:hypothetical protein